jgi:hypothetical protein
MSIKYVNGVPCIDAGGELRKLAALPPPPQMLATASRFSDNVAAPDPSTWQDFDFTDILPPIIRNQASHGSCTGHAGVTAEDIILRKIGVNTPLLSCTFPYAHVNNGRDEGASVSSILQVLKQLGTCTHAECGTDQIYKQQIPQSAYETAKKYQVFEAFLCRTFEELCEAINRGFPVAFGIQVGNNFSRLSLDGVAPLPDMVVGGHALCGVGIKKYKGVWVIKTQNSWGDRWGMHGFCYLTRGHFTNLIDAYALQYAENTNPPPIATVEKKIITPMFTKSLVKWIGVTDELGKHIIPPEIKAMMEIEDAKFLAAINAPLPAIEPEPEPIKEEAPPAPEPEKIEVATEPILEPVSSENSLMQQLADEPPPPAETPDDDKLVEGGPSLTHTDPEAVMDLGRRNRKNRHRH